MFRFNINIPVVRYKSKACDHAGDFTFEVSGHIFVFSLVNKPFSRFSTTFLPLWITYRLGNFCHSIQLYKIAEYFDFGQILRLFE